MNKTNWPLLPLTLQHELPALARALAQEGVPFELRGAGEEGCFLLYDARRGPPMPRSGQIPIDLDCLRDDPAGDPFETLVDEKSARHVWQIGDFAVSECVARFDKHEIRRRLTERLRGLIEACGGIWLRLAAYPFPYRSALNFRIDYDEFDAEDFDRTLDALSGFESASSHYVCGDSYAAQHEALDRLKGLDVGSHGYFHHVYPTFEENLRNVARGIEVLRSAGIEPRGFAAPYGRWNRELQSAMDRLAITHSSDFSLAYDELPFPTGEMGMLQIPPHPVCLGNFLDAAQGASQDSERQRLAAQAAAIYFGHVARARYRAGAPVFLYGHPTRRLGRYPEVVRAVVETAAGFTAIWKTTLSEFGLWWRQRNAVRMRVERDGRSFVIRAAELPRQYRVAIEYWRGRHVAPMPLETQTLRFSPQALAYENHRPQERLQPVRVDPPEGIKSKLKSYLDWERATPVEELDGAGFRKMMKRTLRRLTD